LCSKSFSLDLLRKPQICLQNYQDVLSIIRVSKYFFQIKRHMKQTYLFLSWSNTFNWCRWCIYVVPDNQTTCECIHQMVSPSSSFWLRMYPLPVKWSFWRCLCGGDSQPPVKVYTKTLESFNLINTELVILKLLYKTTNLFSSALSHGTSCNDTHTHTHTHTHGLPSCAGLIVSSQRRSVSRHGNGRAQRLLRDNTGHPKVTGVTQRSSWEQSLGTRLFNSHRRIKHTHTNIHTHMHTHTGCYVTVIEKLRVRVNMFIHILYPSDSACIYVVIVS